MLLDSIVFYKLSNRALPNLCVFTFHCFFHNNKDLKLNLSYKNHLDSAAKFLNDLDVTELDVCISGRIGQDLQDSINSDGRQLRAAALRHHLRVQGSVGRLKNIGMVNVLLY